MKSIAFFNKPYTLKNLSILFIVAFLLRAGTFYFFIQHHELYKQPDSNDYHISALGITTGIGTYHIVTKKPLFWRTPGYPTYLSWFYSLYPLTDARFSSCMSAQKASIWVQIFLCSCIPILAFFLALLLTSSLELSWIVGWIFVFHLGFVLASCYILTDALSMIFFLLFLIFFYKGFSFLGESSSPNKKSYYYLIFAALNIALYTWMRPNGQFIAYLALFIMLFSNDIVQKKLLKLALFASVFFLSIIPWYIRNHDLTGHWFFCPMSGPYLQAFSAPKILRRISHKPLEECHRTLFQEVLKEKKYQEELMKIIAPHHTVSLELICKRIAWPWISKYPGYFLIDWIKEVCKTTFDLYASQIVSIVKGVQFYDPMEEFLSEKLQECIYKQPMHFALRLLCWLELIFSLFIWIGLLGGLWIFLIGQIISRNVSNVIKQTGILWLKTGIMIGGIVGMTGGFGYARLRMPAEALIIILSLTFWFWLLDTKLKRATR